MGASIPRLLYLTAPSFSSAAVASYTVACWEQRGKLLQGTKWKKFGKFYFSTNY
jgi:hypothetical protein